MYFLAISVSVVITVVSGMYSKGDGVVELTPSNFDKEVLQSDSLWLVEFYAPWCGHCQSLAPEWKKAAKALQGAVKVGAVNADDHQSLGGQYGVRGFPTIKIFGLNKRQAEDYQGGRTAQSIVDTAMAKLQSMVKDRMRGKGGSSGGGGGGGGKSADPDAAIELTDSNFEELVLKSKDLWMVEFFAPWCGHCKNLAPHWVSAATEMKGKAKFGTLDATVHTVMASRYGVQGYPTIKMFPAGSKEYGPEEYDGGRTSSDIVRWVEEKLAENLPAPEVVQITSADVLKANCQEKPLCVVAFLPHILDCQSKCRNKYLDILRSVGDNNKKKQWGWIWAEAMAQPDLEKVLGIGGFGYPAMVAINTKKQMYILLKGPFSEKGIGEFIRDLTYGRGTKGEYKKDEIADVEKTEPWDGKDGELPVEEDIDLDDVELDDLDKDEL